MLLQQTRDSKPELLAIEKPYLLPTKRAALLSVIADELHERSAELGPEVFGLSPEEVREAVAGKSRATKFDVADILAHRGFSQLLPLVPNRPARAALGWRPNDKYWLYIFDALASAAAARLGNAWQSRRIR